MSDGAVAAVAPATALDSNAASVYPTHPNEYELKAEIGKGAFATVFLAYCKATNENVAIKILDLEELDTSWEEIRKEIAVMGLLNHPNVVRCLCSFVVDQEIWLVMPLLSGGSCADIMKRNFPKGFDDECLIATILQSALEGLAYLHKDGRIHRDVKAGNILMSTHGEVQIADFGVAGTLVEAGDRRKSRKTFVGTPCWMAPEVMEQTSGYDQKADMWSFGITALELAFGRPPYAQYQPMKVMILTLQQDPPTCDAYQESQKKISRSFKSMVAACLKKDPSKRLTAEKLLQHKFFKQSKNEAHVVDSLLSQISRPKWDQSGCFERSRGPSLGSVMTKDVVDGIGGVTETNEPTVASWVFDDEDLKKLKENNSDAASASPALMVAVPETTSDVVTRASISPETKVGRFTVSVSDVSSEDMNTITTIPQVKEPDNLTRIQTQGRFEVSDVEAETDESKEI